MKKSYEKESADGNMKLRPHHLLCTQGYSGRGYSNEFVENMTAITTHLRGDSTAVVEVVYVADDICSKCPRLLGDNSCKNNDKTRHIDEKVIAYFGIEEKNYVYQEITREINTKITPAIMKDICKGCEWYPVSACRRNILGD